MLRGSTATPIHHQHLSYDYAGRITSTCVTPDAGADGILSEYIYNPQSFVINEYSNQGTNRGHAESFTYSLGGNRIRGDKTSTWQDIKHRTSTYTHGTVGAMPTDRLTQFVSRDGDVTAP